MNEDFLHYLWKFKKITFQNLKTTKNEAVEVISVGEHNFNSGPDFFNAKLIINEQLWAGNVEIHIKSSDWYLHNHENDKNYNNVILHVVWDHDVEVHRANNTSLPTVELKNLVSQTILNNYQTLFHQSKKFINCEKDIKNVNDFILDNWLERMYFERLENKSKLIINELQKSNNNWEAVLFKMMMKNFGLKVNGDSFYSIANSIDFTVVRKLQNNQTQLEAIFFGLAGFLEDKNSDIYYLTLKKEYSYLKNKFQLSSLGIVTPKFFKLRPSNFPTIRLSQFSKLLHKHPNLFSKVIAMKNVEEFYDLFNVKASEYWNEHFTFNKVSSKNKKTLTKNFIDLIIINTILPLKFCYAKSIGQEINEELINVIQKLKNEKNSIIEQFIKLEIECNSAMKTQSLIEMYNNYCLKNKCLQCAIGNHLIKQ